MERTSPVEDKKCYIQFAERHIPHRYFSIPSLREDSCVRGSLMSMADKGISLQPFLDNGAAALIVDVCSVCRRWRMSIEEDSKASQLLLR